MDRRHGVPQGETARHEVFLCGDFLGGDFLGGDCFGGDFLGGGDVLVGGCSYKVADDPPVASLAN